MYVPPGKAKPLGSGNEVWKFGLFGFIGGRTTSILKGEVESIFDCCLWTWKSVWYCEKFPSGLSGLKFGALNWFTPGTLSGLAGLATGEAIDPCEGNAPCWPPTGAPDGEYPSYNIFNSLGFKVMLL